MGTKGRVFYRHKNIMELSDADKYMIYQQIEETRLMVNDGSNPLIQEHSSGFLAITIDYKNHHYITDCFSLESWFKKWKVK